MTRCTITLIMLFLLSACSHPTQFEGEINYGQNKNASKLIMNQMGQYELVE